jgi:sugar fermentation stimulation protein A
MIMELPALIEATLIKRYKRFLADVELDSGELITVHCPNTGAMTACAEPGSRVWLSTSANPKRKYRHSWELARNAVGEMICIHSAKANAIAGEAIEAGVISALCGYDRVRSEVSYGSEKSRIDFLLEGEQGLCYVEVKSVTLATGAAGEGVFPDAVSDRGRKHLRELIAMKAQGHRAVLLFCVLHSAIEWVAPADAIDPKYGETFRRALAAGVEILAYRGAITPARILLCDQLEVRPKQRLDEPMLVPL